MSVREVYAVRLILAMACLAVAVSSSSRGGAHFALHRPLLSNPETGIGTKNGLLLLRCGSTDEVVEDSVSDVEDGVEAQLDISRDVGEEGDEEVDNEPPPSPPNLVTATPARIIIQTNLGNPVLDHRFELNAGRTKDIRSLKRSLSRQIPGRPPALQMELLFEGRVLEDDMLVDELFDDEEEEDDDEDDDEEGDKNTRSLILNTVPPVDPKFATALRTKLLPYTADGETFTTEELVEAYFLNQAAIARNAALLANPKLPSSATMRLEMQEQARLLREQLQSQIPVNVWQESLKEVQKDHNVEERRGQRYRSGKGGASTTLKKSIQTNLNINWGETIRNFVLFLFFGHFGGRNSVSRTLMLWGAPLCFILQARPVKLWGKILFYLMSDAPDFVLSLLPAPQQAILNADIAKSFAILYHPEGCHPSGGKSKSESPSNRSSEDGEETEDDEEEETEEDLSEEEDVLFEDDEDENEKEDD